MVLPARPSCRVAGPASSPTVVEVLRKHLATYAAAPDCDPARLHVLRRIVACRTPAMGTHLCMCEACGWAGLALNSCRNRHCPQCQGQATAKWLAARQAVMLPVPHFQVVFTVPAALRQVARHDPRRLYDILMTASTSLLQDLGAQRLGARLGITAVLHTWASDLRLHPHVHCLVSAGGLLLDDEGWKDSRKDYLFPQRVMGQMFRGRVLEALIDAFDQGELDLGPADPVEAAKAFRQALHAARRRRAGWVVHVEPPNGRPLDHALRYLARYVKRVAIGDQRLVEVTDTHVSFRARGETVRLSGPQFVQRFAQHILPAGFRKVRHYGLYAPGCAKERRAQALALLAGQAPAPPEEGRGDLAAKTDDGAEVETADPEGERCPACGAPQVRRLYRNPAAFPWPRRPP